MDPAIVLLNDAEVKMLPTAASLRSRMMDPAIVMLNEVDAEVKMLETRLHEFESQTDEPSYPDATRVLEVTHDVDEGAMVEGLPVYETKEFPQMQKHIDEGFMYTNDHEEGQMVEGLPVYEMGSVDSLRRSKVAKTPAECEAISAKEANIAEGFEYCANEEEGQMVEDVPSYDISAACTVM